MNAVEREAWVGRLSMLPKFPEVNALIQAIGIFIEQGCWLGVVYYWGFAVPPLKEAGWVLAIEAGDGECSIIAEYGGESVGQTVKAPVAWSFSEVGL